MPVAIPAIAAAAASYGAGLAIAGTTLAGTFAGTVITSLAGLAAATIVSGLITPDAPDITAQFNAAGAGRTQQVRQPISSQQVPFGLIKSSGPILFVHTGEDEHGRVNGWLFLVHALAGVHVAEIGDVYVDQYFSTDERFDGAPGESRLVTVGKHLGEPAQVADAMLLANIADSAVWGADHRLRGRAYLATRLQWHPVGFGSGIPNMAVMLRGHDEIYDPRTATSAWNNNAALTIARWFTADFGMALEWSDLDEDSVIAAANICDQRVLVISGSTTFTPAVESGSPTVFTNAVELAAGARFLDVGDGVRVSTTGALPAGLAAATTYYVFRGANGSIKLATSAANAKAGTAAAITSMGTGTQTLTYYDEARYKLNGAYNLDVAKGDVLKQLLSAMAGVVVYIGGKWFLHAGAAATPIVTITENDLRADMTFTPKRSMRDRFNGVRAVHVNPDANWQPSDAPPLQDGAYVEEDDDEELWEDIRLPFTTSARAVQRLMKIELERNRQQGTVQLPLKLIGMRLQPWDGFFLTIRRPDGSYVFNQEQFRVVEWALSEDGGVDIIAQQDSASVYAWEAAEELEGAVQQGVVLPDPSAIAAPAAVTVVTPVTPTFSRLDASWSEVMSIWLDGYDVEYRAAGAVDWIGYGRVGDDVTRTVSVERSTAQDFRVRAVTQNGSPSAFTENLAPAAPTGVVATGGSGQIEVTWVNAVGATQVQVFGAGTNDFAGSTLLSTVSGALQTYTETPLGAAVTRWYFLRSVNASGNISDATAGVSGTTDP